MADWDVTTVSILEYNTTLGQDANFIKVDDNHFLTAYQATGSHGYQTVLEVNTSTWAITTATTDLDLGIGIYNWQCQIDSTHFLNTYQTGTKHGAIVIEVNTSTWAVTTASTTLQYNNSAGAQARSIAIDTNHFLVTHYNDAGVTVLEVNTSTWAITTATTDLVLELGNDHFPGGFVKMDDNHFLCLLTEQGVGQDAYVLEVNTSTWAVTTTNAKFQYDTRGTSYPWGVKVDDNHVIALYKEHTTNDGYQIALNINTSTWAITTAGAAHEFDGNRADFFHAVLVDDDHLFVNYQGTDSDGFARCFSINTSTWALGVEGVAKEFDTTLMSRGYVAEITYDHFLGNSNGAGGDGFAYVFAVEGVPEPPPPASTFIPKCIIIS